MADEFQEIAHSGGKITFETGNHEELGFGYQVSFASSRPVPVVIIEIYVLAESGVPVGVNRRVGIGIKPEPPPLDGCFLVIVASDSEGKFGHNCPNCKSYWRSGPWPNHCPYCGQWAESYQFLSNAQRRYVRHYCEVLRKALEDESDHTVSIDMDAVADAVGREGEKPSFYVSEESQQHKFTCAACDEFNDILGQFGFCSLCGTRNDLSVFENQTVPAIRDQLKNGDPPENCLRDGVSAFDTFIAQYAKQLAVHVRMTKRRKDRLLNHSFHDITDIRSLFRDWFDIDVCHGMKDEEYRSVCIRFLRRHLYEHNGGQVDQKYLDNSGETKVKRGQRLHETQGDTHDLLGSLVKMARNIHSGFHDLLPPVQGPIKTLEEKKAWLKKHS
jgi:hypothetical protein